MPELNLTLAKKVQAIWAHPKHQIVLEQAIKEISDLRAEIAKLRAEREAGLWASTGATTTSTEPKEREKKPLAKSRSKSSPKAGSSSAKS